MPPRITYASVMTHEIVKTNVLLNDLQLNAADIMISYATASYLEKVWTVLGLEFRQDDGRKALNVRALYGLKSLATFRNHPQTV